MIYRKIKKKYIIEYLLVFLLIATSGANWSIIALAIPCVLVTFRNKIKRYNIIVAIILSLALFVNSKLLATAAFDPHEYMVYVFRFMCVAILCSIMSYHVFMEKYIGIIELIYVISLLIWLVSFVQNICGVTIFPAFITEYFLRDTVGKIPRMRALFWEGGVCQIHGNIALFYLIFTDKLKQRKKSALVFITGILCTVSTTGILILCLQIVLYMCHNYKWPKIGRKILPILGIALIAIVVEEMSLGIIINKIIYHKISGNSRFDDTVLGLLITREHIWTGIGVATDWHKIFISYFYRDPIYLAVRKYYMPDLASSNGLCNCMYKTGVPFTLFYLGKIYSFFKSKVKLPRAEAAVILLIYVFIFIGEPIMSVPLMLMFFFDFERKSMVLVSREV